jgi:hypothetical protein|tara:strand:+ start:184 stop:606 length:423 start_codon:yes stop_codon:yes gene_type:complete
MIQVSYVPREYINSCWKQVEGYLKKATEYTHGRYEVEDLYLAVCEFGHLLWIAFDEKEIKGAVITNVIVYPKKTYLCLAFCGGKEFSTWKDPMLQMLRNWAKDNGCQGLEAVGRKGWTKVFKHQGHKFLWDTFELPLDEG